MSEIDKIAADQTGPSIDRIVVVVERLGGRIVGLLGWVVALTFIVFAVFAGVYIFALFSLPDSEGRDNALQNIERTMLLMWDKIIPIAQTALQVIAPGSLGSTRRLKSWLKWNTVHVQGQSLRSFSLAIYACLLRDRTARRLSLVPRRRAQDQSDCLRAVGRHTSPSAPGWAL